MFRNRPILTLFVLVAVVLATVPQFGFAGPPSAGGNATVLGADADANQSSNETTAGQTTTPTGDEIRADAVRASRDVETYRLTATINRSVSAGPVDRTVNVTTRGVFDRSVRELRVDETTMAPGQTVDSSTYVVNESIYLRSDAFVQQYSSEWITLSLSENLSQRWETLDTLSRQRAILANASVEFDRTESLNDTRAYVLRADVNETSYVSALSTGLDAQNATENINVTNASFTYWIDAETRRIVRSEGTVESTMSLQGQSVNVTERLTLRFDAYDAPVSVTLPDEAATAVRIGNATTTETRTTENQTDSRSLADAFE